MDTELSLIEKNNESTKSFVKLYNRTNRLVSAVFLVVNVMENNDHLKNRIKELSMLLLSVCVKLKDERDFNLRALLSQTEKVVLELLSLLEISSVSGLISQMNASILKEEFESFLKAISEFSTRVEQGESLQVKEIIDKEDTFKDVVVDTQIKPHVASKPVSVVSSKNAPTEPALKDENKGQNRKNFRQIAIMEFVKSHPSASIKEIAPNIRGCGEKTIQRELVELVKFGKVSRVGERRWSRYSIA